jgi:glyoxylase-like metal-dependent hydrolase (beta-lactamase superfamily II)
MIVVGICLTLTAFQPLWAESEPPFRVQRLSERVIVFTELSPWESNHVVVVGADGLVLVDPGHTPLMGRLIREAVARELGRDRFDYVIDTHEHWGHTWGNAAFPEALVVGHERAADAIEADAANLARRAEFIQTQADEAEAALADLDPDSEEAGAARLRRDHLERISHGLAETGVAVRPPRLTFSDRLSLDLGDVTLEMLYLGRGHSDSDIVVLIPEEKVLLMGCFFLEQGPLPVFGTRPTLDPDRWLEVLDTVLDPQVGVERVVLGQHTVWPADRLAAMRDYIAWLWPAVQELDAEGVDLETAMVRLPIPRELDLLREAGATEEDLVRFHRNEITTLWRQTKESAAAIVGQAIDDGDAAAGVARYRELMASGSHDVFFDENEFNLLGYRLLGEERYPAAIAVFELNVEAYPESWNVYDSLGEACMLSGDRERAIELYRQSLAINPANTNGAAMLERLGVEP